MSWRQRIAEEARQSYPHECCGILLGKNAPDGKFEVTEIRALPNRIQGEGRGTHFEADPLFLYQVEREIEGSGLEIVGFYHSHPDYEAIPSREDAKNMVPGLVYVIVSVTKEGVVDIRSYRRYKKN